MGAHDWRSEVMQALSRSRSVFLVGMLTVSFAAFAGDVFYWKGGYSAWQSWSDLSLWSSAKDSVIMSGHVPGSDPSDLLWPFGTAVVGINHFGKFDWRQSYTIRVYLAGPEHWKSISSISQRHAGRVGPTCWNCNAEISLLFGRGRCDDRPRK